MNRTNLKLWARMLVPGAKVGRISNILLESILQEGANDVASYTTCLPDDAKFTVTEDEDEYDIADIADDFLEIAESGVWWNNGSKWGQVFSRTREWMDNEVPNWRDKDSSDPVWFFKAGSILTFVPAPDTTLSNGGWLYYGKRPPQMESNAYYPFGGETEISELAHLSYNVLDFWKWHAHGILGEDKLSRDAQVVYYSKLAMARVKVKTNKSLFAEKKTRLKGRRIV